MILGDYQDVQVIEQLVGPYTCPALATLFVVIAGIGWIAAYRRGERRRVQRFREEQGLCLDCGYNLTGNVSAICPECGQPIPETQKNSLPQMGHR